jgi:glutamyl-tRNA synthetase
VEQTAYFFQAPTTWDLDALKPKWTPEKQAWFTQWTAGLAALETWNTASIEADFKQAAATGGIKPGELQLPFRVMLVGGKFGPPVFEIAALVGRNQTIARIEAVLAELSKA